MGLSVAQIIDIIRKLTKTTTAQIPDADILLFLNIEYHKIWNKIIDLDDNYKMQTWFANLIANQNEYTILQQTATTYGQGKIESVSIKYDDTMTYYSLANMWTWDNLDVDRGWYEVNQTKLTPFVVISDNSIFIYPTPKSNFANGIKMQASRKPYDLTTSMTVDDILIPDEFEDILIRAVKPYIYQIRELIDKKNDAQKEFEEKEERMLRILSTRKTHVVNGIPQDLRFLEGINVGNYVR